MPQSEAQLEELLLSTLANDGYERINLRNENDLLINLKKQIEIHNSTQDDPLELTDNEFKTVLSYLSQGDIFDKANILRNSWVLTFDNPEDHNGEEEKFIRFIDSNKWCKNEFQVTNQITMTGETSLSNDGTENLGYTNRYDVTILINGLPIVQIELKRSGVPLKEAFHQITRYKQVTFPTGNKLFEYLQIMIISNREDTKYYANNPIPEQKGGMNDSREEGLHHFKQTFYWSDVENNHIKQLLDNGNGKPDFTTCFLNKCHLAKMITKYMVISKTNKTMMILRPYQFYAVELLVNKALATTPQNDKTNIKNKGGYIWHTTGSGKTLTSFKASQILAENPKIDIVLFIVDRKDLDNQTIDEFNAYKAGCVSANNNITELRNQVNDINTKLVVTTIQKLGKLLGKSKHQKFIEGIKDKKIIFIFDECHRSQFGETHTAIKSFFTNSKMFGFTGTPIFEENANKGRTTADLFGQSLHKYVITNAIADDNVLKFQVEYFNTMKKKIPLGNITKGDGFPIGKEEDEEVEAINTKEAQHSPIRLNNITDHIIKIHNKKTKNKRFTAMFAVDSIPTLLKYYKYFKSKEKSESNPEGHDLKIATIFSYHFNEPHSLENPEAIGTIDEGDAKGEVDKYSREELDNIMGDYKKTFKSAPFRTSQQGDFQRYRKDVSQRVKNREIDILIVVDMFLTGFDSKPLNTLYVDKNLQYHGLIQSFSRTNRILGEEKPYGNIICYRGLRDKVNQAIKLYGNTDNPEIALLENFEFYLEKITKKIKDLKQIIPVTTDLDDIEIQGETKTKEFIQAFKEVRQVKEILKNFVEFDKKTMEEIDFPEDEYNSYQGKYYDLYERANNKKDNVNILDDIDFGIEDSIIDIINVDFILTLIAEEDWTESKKNNKEKIEERIKSIMVLVSSHLKLRSKRGLIEKFIREQLVTGNINTKDKEVVVEDLFNNFLNIEENKYIKGFSKEYNINEQKVKVILKDYVWENKRLPKLIDVVELIGRQLEELDPISQEEVYKSFITRIEDYDIKFNK